MQHKLSTEETGCVGGSCDISACARQNQPYGLRQEFNFVYSERSCSTLSCLD